MITVLKLKSLKIKSQKDGPASPPALDRLNDAMDTLRGQHEARARETAEDLLSLPRCGRDLLFDTLAVHCRASNLFREIYPLYDVN